jgi:dTDP-4-amino-4,6-dideoxygalactose transaminase
MNAVLQTMVDEKIGPGERKQEFNRLFCEIAGRKYEIMLLSY